MDYKGYFLTWVMISLTNCVLNLSIATALLRTFFRYAALKLAGSLTSQLSILTVNLSTDIFTKFVKEFFFSAGKELFEELESFLFIFSL